MQWFVPHVSQSQTYVDILKDILTWTYFYRRMTQNPNFYDLSDVSHQHLSDHLSELVENTLNDLVGSKCILIGLFVTLIIYTGSYVYTQKTTRIFQLSTWAWSPHIITYPVSLSRFLKVGLFKMQLDLTVELYMLSLRDRTRLKGLLEIISSSIEFESIPIRRHEDVLLRHIYERIPVKLNHVDYDAPRVKTFLLLQAHFSRMQLPPDLASDQKLVLRKVSTLLCACIDVMSSNAWLSALSAMDLSQMCVQAMWETESPLKQIPHFGSDVRDFLHIATSSSFF